MSVTDPVPTPPAGPDAMRVLELLSQTHPDAVRAAQWQSIAEQLADQVERLAGGDAADEQQEG